MISFDEMDDQIKQESKQQQQQQSETTTSSTTQYSIGDLNVNFLSQIYEIMRCLEKETQENSVTKTVGNKQTSVSSAAAVSVATTQPTLSTSEYVGKMNRLRETFEQFRQQIPLVPGSNVTKDEQLQTLGSLRQQLIMKKDLLLKYKKSTIVDHIPSQIQSTSGNSIIKP
ncbi:mediator complex subunit 9 [Dermatophagoides farinae]|uniref:Mediator of RNA polymerase II transcription subunit 9 n=1 Tax=Dermatophagoides farinae TaxID=6954 RepID=A0A922KUI6_DERFA|nr:hypothetical protein DERF_014525 [Dermatophagoides farinae]